MKTLSLRSACLVSSVALSFAWVGCGSSDSGGTTTTTDSGHPATDSGTQNADSSTDSAFNLDSSTTDSGVADSAKTDSSTTDSKSTDSTATDSTASDSSTTDVGTDTSTTETTTDAGTDTPTGTTSGTKLLDGDFTVRGITTDDQILFIDNAATGGGLKTIPVTGTTATTIASSFDPTTGAVLADGKVAFVLSGLAAGSALGALDIWSAGNGFHSLSTNVIAGVDAALPDGSYVMFADNAATDGSTADLVLVKSDGTGKTTVFAGVDTSNYTGGTTAKCTPSVRAAGTAFLVVHCTPTDTSGSIDVVSTAGAKTSISTNSGFASTDTAGDKIFFIDSTGAGKLVGPSGGTATSVDTNVAGGFLSNDGSTLVYLTSSGSTFTVKKTATATVSPITISGGITLDTTNGNPILAVAPTLSAILYASSIVTGGSVNVSDVNLLTTASASTAPVSLVASGGTAGSPFGDAFTTDGSRVLYYSSIDTSTSGGFGTLVSRALTGTTDTTIGTGVWEDLAGTGTKVVFNQNTDTSTGAADLASVDTATTATPTSIAMRADLSFTVDHARDKVVYTTHSVSAPGLYVAPVP